MNPQPADVGIGSSARDRVHEPPARSRPALVIAGASCRAATASATAVGWQVFAADCFDDFDLGGVAAATRRVHGYPEGVVTAVADFPAAPWCYTGALENHLSVVERITATRPLAGCAPAAVRLVRDPATLGALARDAGLAFPDTHASPAGLPTDGTYLRKPRASAGGHGIAPWTGTSIPTTDSAWVWQRRVAGEALSAVLALGPGSPRLLGMSRQLVGKRWCHAPAFGFCGAIGLRPGDLPPADTDRLERFAVVLAAAGLRGVIGVDLVGSTGSLHVIEVNPRPTASAELVERASGESILATHLAAFGLASPRPSSGPASDTRWSKAILFAPAVVTIDEPFVTRLLDRTARWTSADGRPALGDVPQPGQTLRAGSPVLTVFAHGESVAESLDVLRKRIAALEAVVE